VGWFSESADTYEIEIVDPDDESLTATITCKRLTAGDHADVVDAMHDEERGEGRVRQLIVERAVVGWTLPEAYSPGMLAGLKPEVFLQIWAGIRQEDVNPFARAALLAASHAAAAEATTPTDDPAPAEPAPADGA
jgi:hypothetical protein